MYVIEYQTINIKTLTASKNTWKTYNVALDNCGPYDMVTSDAEKSLDWIKRNPVWTSERIALINKERQHE